METPDVLSIANLFGEYRVMKKDGKVESERASLVRFFVNKLDKDPKVMGIRLAHYKDIGVLYSLKSQYEDRERRDGAIAAKKWFWWVTRTSSVSDLEKP